MAAGLLGAVAADAGIVEDRLDVAGEVYFDIGGRRQWNNVG
jgi:hypothetical protein